jgi:hypothetical protein
MVKEVREVREEKKVKAVRDDRGWSWSIDLDDPVR